MLQKNPPIRQASGQEILDRVRALTPRFRDRAAAAEEARRLPEESAREMLDAGLARVLVPRAFGGYELGLDVWFDAAREISKADASHGWCASLLIHHPHVIGMFPEAAQQEVWTNGADVAFAASVQPNAQATRVAGGYRVSGKGSPSASGVGHCTWAVIGALVQGDGEPEYRFFLVPQRDYSVRDTWFTAGMCATGSNTIVTDNVFVPEARTLRASDLRDGTGPGGAIHADPIYRAPFYAYSSLTFVAAMLGAAQGAYDYFRDWTRTRTASRGGSVAERSSVHVGMARVAADLDAAELLLRRATQVPYLPAGISPDLLARSVRDFSRAAEMVVVAIDTVIAMSGMAGFTSANPIQRTWRDIHFAAMHVGLAIEPNYGNFGRRELGLPRDPSHPFL